MGGGPPKFTPGSTCPALLGKTSGGSHLSLTGLSPCFARLSRLVQLESTFVTPWKDCNPSQCIPRHRVRNTCRFTRTRFRLIPLRSPLLRKSRFLYFPEGTEMFQFSSLPTVPYVFRHGHCDTTRSRFPHSEIHGSWLASQLPVAYRRHTTSFVGSMRQSIHRMPFVT